MDTRAELHTPNQVIAVLSRGGLVDLGDSANIRVESVERRVRLRPNQEASRHTLYVNEQPVASIKRIPLDGSLDMDAVVAVYKEYQPAKRFRPVGLRGLVRENEELWIVEEFVADNCTLDEMVADGRLTPDEATRRMVSIVDDIWDLGAPADGARLASELDALEPSFAVVIEDGSVARAVFRAFREMIERQAAALRTVLSTRDYIGLNILRAPADDWVLVDYDYARRTSLFALDVARNLLHVPYCTNTLLEAKAFAGMDPSLVRIAAAAAEYAMQTDLNPSSAHARILADYRGRVMRAMFATQAEESARAQQELQRRLSDAEARRQNVEAELREQGDARNVLRSAIEDKDRHIANIEAELRQACSQEIGLTRLIEEKNARLDAQRRVIEDKDRYISNIEAEVRRVCSQESELKRLAEEQNAKLGAQATALRQAHETQVDQARRAEEKDRLLAEAAARLQEAGAQHSAKSRAQQELMDRIIGEKDVHIKNVEAMLLSIQNSRAWWMLSLWRRTRHELWRRPRECLQLLRSQGPRIVMLPAHAEAQPPKSYADWMRDGEQMPDRRQAQRTLAGLRRRPLISVLMPTYNSRVEFLREAIHSVQDQLYPDWELCIADDGSTQPEVRGVLEAASATDPRIRVTYAEANRGIAAASNAALSMAKGEMIALLDHDDVLAPHALLEVAAALDGEPDLDMLYSDEDKLDPEGKRCDPFFKPDWSPETFLSYMYTCHLGVYRTALVRQVGGFREGYEGSQDYDLVLRVTEHTQRIRHIPKLLYRWRMTPESTALLAKNKEYAEDSARRALADAMQRREVEFRSVDVGRVPTTYRVRYRIPEQSSVAILIPSRNNRAYLERCVESVLARTDYASFGVYVIDNGSDDPATVAYLEQIAGQRKSRVLRYDRPFNYSAINNWAVAQTQEPYLLFLNDDTETIDAGWLEAMMEHASRPAVGAVGAKLLYPDGRIQHAGVITGLRGVAGHAHKYFPRDDPGYCSRLIVVQNVSAVTAACLLMRRDVFQDVGGFNESDLAVAFNDVDLCLRVREAGYQIIFTPFAELYHHESVSRGLHLDSAEVEYMQRKWGERLLRDPFYNRNLTLDREDFSLS